MKAIKAIILWLAGFFILPFILAFTPKGAKKLRRSFTMIRMEPISHISGVSCITGSKESYKASKIFSFPFRSYISRPFSSIFSKVDASLTARIVYGFRHIPAIIFLRDASEIINSIVKPIMVYMVDFILRPFSMHIEPRQTCSSIMAGIDPDKSVSIDATYASSFFSGIFSSASKFPSKYAGIRVIVQNFFQSFLSEHKILQSVIHPVRQGDQALPHRLDVEIV